MYCVRCGVSLEEGVRECPLCGTPVWNPEEKKPNPHYNPSLYPVPEQGGKWIALTIVTIVMAVVSLGCLLACIKYYGRAAWSSYVVFSCLLVYIAAVLPCWFRRYLPVIFLPVSFAALAGYLLFICLYTGGKWFLSFAFPLTMLTGLIATASVALFRFGKRRRLRKTGILLIAIGSSTMLVELFQDITFGGETYVNIIRNIREPELERRFFSRLVELGVPVSIETNQKT